MTLDKSKYLPRLAMVAATAMLALVCYQSGHYLFVNEKVMERLVVETSNADLLDRATSKEMNFDFRQMSHWHIFGENTIQSNAPITVAPIKAPETQLKLELLGVALHSNGKGGQAIIAETGKKQRSYSTGDKLPGEALLYAIEAQRVILHRNNQHESLTMKKPDPISLNAQIRSVLDE